MKRPLARVVMPVIAACLLLAGVAGPASADTRTFKHPKQQVSDQFRFNNACPYKIFYGQFGRVAFGEVRIYGGCAGVYAGVGLYTTQGGRRLPDNTGSGEDGCGGYFFRQIHVDGVNATGMFVDFVGGNRRIFRPDIGEATSGRPC